MALGLCGPCRQYWTKVTKLNLSDERAQHLRKIVDTHEDRKTDVATEWKKQTVDEKRQDPDRYLKGRNKGLKERYGITLEQYNVMLQQQNGVCTLCESPPKNKPLYVDHCHKTGTVRGLLCAGCNTKMALIDDGPETIQRFLNYALKYKEGK